MGVLLGGCPECPWIKPPPATPNSKIKAPHLLVDCLEVQVGVRAGVVKSHDPLVRHQIPAFVEATGEQVDAHDGENQPEDQADEEYVADGRDGSDQSVHHHL